MNQDPGSGGGGLEELGIQLGKERDSKPGPFVLGKRGAQGVRNAALLSRQQPGDKERRGPSPGWTGRASRTGAGRGRAAWSCVLPEDAGDTEGRRGTGASGKRQGWTAADTEGSRTRPHNLPSLQGIVLQVVRKELTVCFREQEAERQGQNGRDAAA